MNYLKENHYKELIKLVDGANTNYHAIDLVSISVYIKRRESWKTPQPLTVTDMAKTQDLGFYHKYGYRSAIMTVHQDCICFYLMNPPSPRNFKSLKDSFTTQFKETDITDKLILHFSDIITIKRNRLLLGEVSIQFLWNNEKKKVKMMCKKDTYDLLCSKSGVYN